MNKTICILFSATAFLCVPIPSISQELVRVENAVPECPAFDVVQRRILEVTGSAGQQGESEIEVDTALPVAVELILDASGSMAGQIGGEQKLDMARAALSAALTALDTGSVMSGLRAYGFDTSVEKTALASCPNTELLDAFHVSAASEHMRSARNLQPYGYTPIASSLRAAANDLNAVDARDRMIILISDGEETCGGDPVRAAADIRSQGISVATYVVGFDLDGDQRAQMEAVAAAGGGAYFDARDRSSLQHAIEEAVGVVTRKSERRIERCLNPLVGGRTLETAVPLLPGLYTVGEVIPEGERRYYNITTESGQIARIRGLLQSWRTVGDTDGASQQTDAGLGAFTFDLLDFEGKPVGGRTARERDIPGTSAEVDYLETTGAGFILAIGDNYDPVSSDTLFALNIENAFDGTGQGDSSESSPVALLLDQNSEAYIGHDDVLDSWRATLSAPPGNRSGWPGAWSLQVQPDIADYRLRIKVWGERDGQPPERLRSDDAGSGSWSINGNGTLPPNPYDSVLVTVENLEPRLDSHVTRYTIGVFAED